MTAAHPAVHRSGVPRPSALGAIRVIPGVSPPREVVAGITLAALMIPLDMTQESGRAGPS